MTGARHLRLRPARVGPLFLRWLFQGTSLALVVGALALAVGAVGLAFAFVALALWPVTLLGGFVLLAAWAMRRGWFRPGAIVRPTAPAPAPPVTAHASKREEALPPSVRERIERIRQKAGALAGSRGSPEDRHLVRSTVDH